MGMSGTQARLLAITAQLHDVENKAMKLENEKISLATQQDEVYRTYCDALDATKIQVAYNDGSGKVFIDATYANVCEYDPNRYQQYSLKDSKTGKQIVSDNIANIYKQFSNDKYAFAWAMLSNGKEGIYGNWTDITSSVNIGFETINKNSDAYKKMVQLMNSSGVCDDIKNLYKETMIPMMESGNLYMTDAEALVYNKYTTGSDADKTLENKLKAVEEIAADSTKSRSEKNEVLSAFREYLYSKYGKELFNYMQVDKQQTDYAKPEDVENPEINVNGDKLLGPSEYSKDEFNFYVRMFESIQESGGCITVPEEYETGTDANKWFNDMVESGRAIICVYNENTKEWNESSVATSVNQNYIQRNQDETDLKKAEAEYEYQLGIINKKDTEIDKELSKLETTRNSLKQEEESYRKIIEENTDRTFGIFG